MTGDVVVSIAHRNGNWFRGVETIAKKRYLLIRKVWLRRINSFPFLPRVSRSLSNISSRLQTIYYTLEITFNVWTDRSDRVFIRIWVWKKYFRRVGSGMMLMIQNSHESTLRVMICPQWSDIWLISAVEWPKKDPQLAVSICAIFIFVFLALKEIPSHVRAFLTASD